MVDLKALKRVKYPHGPTGREYQPGESFKALSERDAKALVVSGRAELGAPANATDLPRLKEGPRTEPSREQVEDRPNEDVPRPLVASEAKQASYLRRDMQAEENRNMKADEEEDEDRAQPRGERPHPVQPISTSTATGLTGGGAPQPSSRPDPAQKRPTRKR